ncbi:Subunit of heteropentameric Replication factor C (RF-C) [Malassezia vespertilionis]|nr:Subunit of heteropentameric Replication factor C (RF-C) [Malassezia vespertilionis]WFD06853.1 Subunit of heteropentameric Replication factor C (RF-C) [Malassezia vespertilionis]
MLFYGPPGTGKTSTILALARQLYGPELMKSRVLELNASDERGISVVREKIKSFAKMAVSMPNPGYPSPPYKIIILDEADSMTQDAQGALRRTMELYSRTTRFCLICNYVTRIIEPVASRCSKFRFRPLDLVSTEARLQYIADNEGLSLNKGMIPALINASDGDMRRSITYLQSIARLASTRSGNVSGMSPDAVAELAGFVPKRVIEHLALSIGVEPSENDTEDLVVPAAASAFDRIYAAVQCIERAGYSSMQVVLQLHDYIILHPLLNARQKTKCALQLGETDKALMDGGNESLQLLSLSLQLHEAIVAA